MDLPDLAMPIFIKYLWIGRAWVFQACLKERFITADTGQPAGPSMQKSK